MATRCKSYNLYHNVKSSAFKVIIFFNETNSNCKLKQKNTLGKDVNQDISLFIKESNIKSDEDINLWLRC